MPDHRASQGHLVQNSSLGGFLGHGWVNCCLSEPPGRECYSQIPGLHRRPNCAQRWSGAVKVTQVILNRVETRPRGQKGAAHSKPPRRGEALAEMYSVNRRRRGALPKAHERSPLSSSCYIAMEVEGG